MEIPGDALTVVDQRERLHCHVQPGVVDGHRRGAGQPDDEFLVELTEVGGVDLVGQVQVAEHLVADLDRDTEKGTHRRMMGREPETVGVGAQVRESQRSGIGDQHPQDAVTLREMPDGVMGVIIDADGEELGQADAGLVEDTEGAVPGADQLDCGLDDAVQHRFEIEIRADRQNRVQQATKRRHRRPILHGAERNQGAGDDAGRPDTASASACLTLERAGRDVRLYPRSPTGRDDASSRHAIMQENLMTPERPPVPSRTDTTWPSTYSDGAR